MEYVITAIALAAFGYFIWTRIKASKESKANNSGSSGGGGSGGGGSRTHPK